MTSVDLARQALADQKASEEAKQIAQAVLIEAEAKKPEHEKPGFEGVVLK